MSLDKRRILGILLGVENFFLGGGGGGLDSGAFGSY